MSAFRAQATQPALSPIDWEQQELAELTEQLAVRLDQLRHVMGRRLAKEGRGLAVALREGLDSPQLLVERVMSFQERGRDLLTGSR